MLRSSILVGLLSLYGIILAEDIMPHDELYHYISHAADQTSRTGRFGFSFIHDLRKNLCHSFCTSADTMPYFLNLMCAAKCPELYLPHRTTTESTTTSTTAETTAATTVTPTTSVTPTTLGPTPVSSSEQPTSGSSSSAPNTNPAPTTTQSTSSIPTSTQSTTTSSTTTSSTTPNP